MKTTKKNFGIALVLSCVFASTLKAQNLYVINQGTDSIGEYGLNGSTVNASLVTGLQESPLSIAISGNDMFIVSVAAGTVGEYTTSGATVNTSLITGLSLPQAIAISSNDLFVAK